MVDTAWKRRIGEGRDMARSGIDNLSTSAREVADAAQRRLNSTYGTARERAAEWGDDGRELASAGIEYGKRAAERSRGAMDRLLVDSRSLIAERPMAAVAAGIAAGVALGYLANRLAKRAAQSPYVEDRDDEDEDYHGA